MARLLLSLKIRNQIEEFLNEIEEKNNKDIDVDFATKLETLISNDDQNYIDFDDIKKLKTYYNQNNSKGIILFNSKNCKQCIIQFQFELFFLFQGKKFILMN